MKTYDNKTSKYIRRLILEMSYKAKTAHIPSAISMCDYLGVLFEKTVSPQTHRFVLGKPFGAQTYYALFAYYGWASDNFFRYGSLDVEWRYIIQKDHPLITYIDESMGNCLSVACGIALARKKVFVNISDAAFQEGSIWESILYAGAHNLSNLSMAVDNNNMQALGKISEISDIGDVSIKLNDFGWEVFECDGHDIDKLHELCNMPRIMKSNKPKAFVFHTTKGQGVSFLEENSLWHYSILDEISLKKALKELE